MKFALIDLETDGRKANREHTGGFGSFMRADGIIGGFTSLLKQRLINLPITAFGFTQAILREKGHVCTFYKRPPLNNEDIVIIASSMHCYAQEVEFAKELKEQMPQAKIGFYGPFAQTKPEYFEEAADFIIGGELETTILAYLDGEHDFSGKLNYGIVQDFASLPMPDWDGMLPRSYSYFPMLHKRHFLPMQASRGCSFNCDFCPYMVSQTKKYRRRDPKIVVDEMERNIEKYGMRSFLFRDICYTLNKKYAAEISEEMLRRGLDLEWGCETRLDCLTPELIDLMVESGLKGMNIGVEAYSNEILQNSGKKNPEIEHQEATIAYLKNKGVRINAFFMLGLTGDTTQSMNDTIDYAKRLNTQGAQFCVTTPFPGTSLFDLVEKQLITDDFTQFTEYDPVLDIGTSSVQEVKSAHTKAYSEYYLRWDWLKYHGVSTTFRLAESIISSIIPAKKPKKKIAANANLPQIDSVSKAAVTEQAS